MKLSCSRIEWKIVAFVVLVILGCATITQAGYLEAVTNTPGLQHYWSLDEPDTPETSTDMIGGKVAVHLHGYPTNAVGGGPVSTSGPRPSDGFAGMSASNGALLYNILGKTRSIVENPDQVGSKSFAAGDMTGLSMEFWYKRTTTNHEGVMVGYNNQTGLRYGFTATLITTDTNTYTRDVKVYNKDLTDNQTAYYLGSTPDTGWHHMVMAWDGRNFRSYLDGQEPAASVGNSSGLAIGAIKPADELVFGGEASLQDIRYFNGALDQVAIYDRALTAVQASRHYEAAVTGTYAVQPYEQMLLDLRPCHYWRLDETYNMTALDSIGNWTARQVGSPKLGEEGLRPPVCLGFETNNYAATFTRTSSCGLYFTNSVVDALAPGNTFSDGTVTSLTMSVWFRLSESGPDNARQIIAGFQKKTGTRYSFLVQRESTGYLRCYVTDNSGETQLIKTPYANVTDSNWHNFVMTWDGSAMRTYLDGGDEKTYTGTGVSGALRANDGFYLGMDCGANNYFDGKLDEVALFNTALTAKQITDLYKAAVRGKIPKGTCILLSSADCGAADEAMPTRGVCAHRGAMATHPENTLAAFREAIRLGAHMIEFDVALTKDARMVLMHDPTVDRTTDGTGNVADLTFEQIRTLDAGSWKDPQFTGERVPTLEETLSIMPVNVWLNVHTKGDTTLANLVAGEIVRQGRTHQAFIATGRAAATAARQVYPSILICNMENQGYSTAYVTDTISHGDAFIQLLGQVASPEDMARLKEARVHINCFLGNQEPDTAEELATLFADGVEFPLVDNLGPMVKAAQAQGIEPLVPKYRLNGLAAVLGQTSVDSHTKQSKA